MEMQKTSLIELLNSTMLDTVAHFGLPEEALQRTYGEGKWSIRKILVHLSDAEDILLGRIKKVIAEPKQVIYAFDQDLWSQHLDYDNYPLELSQQLFSASRGAVIHLAERFYEELGDKEYIHSEVGTRSLSQEFKKVALHNQVHLQQIEKALNRN